MSSLNQTPREEAAAWHARLGADDTSEQDWLAFERWMMSPPNKAAYDALDSMVATVEAERVEVSQAMTPRARIPTALWATAALGLAAVLVGLVVLGPQKAQEYAYAAPASAPRTITLRDNSVVRLNRGASLRVRFDGLSRRIFLDRGEAAFAVQHDASRPFSVAAGDVTIRDIGTEFNVVRAARYVTVTVREGQVAMTPVDGRVVNLGVGEQGRVDRDHSSVTVSAANPEDAFAWQAGRLIYRDAPLAQIVEDISRYSNEPVLIADRHATTLRFTGVLVIDEPAVMVRRLEAFLPIRSAQDGDRIVVRSRQ